MTVTSRPITGELRDAMLQLGWVEKDGSITFTTSPMPPSIDAEQSLAISGSDFDRLCDAIDSIHANLERENTSLKAELDRLMGDQDRDGWIELPKDADGKPIRFKDKVTVPWSDKVYEVGGFSYQENVHIGTMTIWINTHIDGEYRALCATDSCHHHMPDTWERIIEDALGARWTAPDELSLDYDALPTFDALVARCRALAGDAS